MTAVGKILVFFNLIFSLVLGAFVVLVYISQSHWVTAYNDLAQKYQVADASNAAYQKQLQQAQDYTKDFNDKVLADKELETQAGLKGTDDFKLKLKKIKDTLDAALADAKAQKDQVKKLQDDVAAAQKKMADDAASLTTALAEADRHLSEAQDVRARLKTEEDKNTAMVKALGTEHDEKVAMKIRADSAELREKELANENDKLARDNQKLIANGSTLNTALKRDAMNPPLENVEGVIREVDPSGLVRISIGSDAGLVKGNTLEVYRLNTQAPSESRYLGRIKLLDVRNTEAVGQLLSKPPVPPQVGDTVSSKIAGG